MSVHKSKLKLFSTFQSCGRYYCVVMAQGTPAYYRFGISRAAHQALRDLLAFRPFDQMPGVAYHYYIDRAVDMQTIAVMIEQGRLV